MILSEYLVNDRIAYITLNRAEKKNALSPQLVRELTRSFMQAGSDPEVKCIVLKANGTVFSAGADLAYLQELQSYSYEDNKADSENLKELLYLIYTTPKVVIAQVEGHAIAGGCGLISVCDVVFSVEEAKFGYTEVKIGFIPALVACFLVRKIGEGRVRELLLSGDLVTAQTALSYGLINFMSKSYEIRNDVEQYARQICRQTSAQSIASTKELINMAQNLTLEDSLAKAIEMNARTRATEDCKRGIAAFINKEKFEW